MKEKLYIFSNSTIRRKDKTILVERIPQEPEVISDDEAPEDDADYLSEELLLGLESDLPSGDKKHIPIESIEAIYSFGTLRFNSRFLSFLSRNLIPLHLFSFTGSYGGSFYPSARAFSGTILTLQVLAYRHKQKRIEIAREFIVGAIANAIMNLKYYQARGAHVSDNIEQMEEMKSYLSTADSIDEIMGLEGHAKRTYYAAWKELFVQPVAFEKRVKNPPNNLVNALISYGNMIVYALCLDEIYHTRLYPEIGFLHEPGEQKLSLSYDLAEIFKPLITDRAIFKVINKHIISEQDGIYKNNRYFLKKEAKQSFVKEIEHKLLTKIQIDGKDKRITYKSIIRNECYKLINTLQTGEAYKSYLSKW